jgi:predicted transcriptional regulator
MEDVKEVENGAEDAESKLENYGPKVGSKNRITKEMIQKMFELRKQGMSYTKIAKMLNIRATATVMYYLDPKFRERMKSNTKKWFSQNKNYAEKRNKIYMKYYAKSEKFYENFFRFALKKLPKERVIQMLKEYGYGEYLADVKNDNGGIKAKIASLFK